MLRVAFLLICILAANTSQAKEAELFLLNLSCEGLADKPNVRPYQTQFKAIVSADGRSLVGHESWGQSVEKSGTKKYTGFIDQKSRKVVIKGEGRTGNRQNSWSLFFEAKGVNSFDQALSGSGMKGREGDGSWAKPCVLRLVKSLPIDLTNLKSKIANLENSANSFRQKYLNAYDKNKETLKKLTAAEQQIYTLKFKVKDRDKSLASANEEIKRLKRQQQENVDNDGLNTQKALEIKKANEKIEALEALLLSYRNNLSTANAQIERLTKSLAKSEQSYEKGYSWEDLKSQIEIQQRQFCSLTENFFRQLQEAKKTRNEIRVNLVFMQRQEDLDALIPSGTFKNWIFEVVKIDQVPDGSAAVILKLQCDTTVGSGFLDEVSTAKGEEGWRATIPYNDRRFRELAKLSTGQFVTASGQFLEVKKFKPGQPETFYASMPIGDHPLVRSMNLLGELFIADFSYIAALTR